MPKHNKRGINYSQRLRAIRPFVDFNYDLRKPLNSAAKRRINDYYEYIQKLTVRPHQVNRARDGKKLRALQRFAQHDTRHQHLKVAFIPNAGTERMKVRVTRNGEVRGQTGHIGVFEIPLDAERLAREGRRYIQRAIDKGPEVQRYVIQAGAFEVPNATTKRFIVDEVLKYMERYGADKFDEDDPSSHYYGNWLFGINGYRFHNQAELSEYREARRAHAQKRSRQQLAERRRESRVYYWLNDETATAKEDRAPQPHPWRRVTKREYYRHIYALGYREI